MRQVGARGSSGGSFNSQPARSDRITLERTARGSARAARPRRRAPALTYSSLGPVDALRLPAIPPPPQPLSPY